jgi:hypothetical protein
MTEGVNKLKQDAPELKSKREKNRTLIDEQKLSEYLHVSLDKISDIRRRILKNNGHLAIAVHPFYQEYLNKNRPALKGSVAIDDRPGIYLQKRVAQEHRNFDSVPTIVMEELDNLDATSARLGNNSAVIVTAGGSGKPWMIEHNDTPDSKIIEKSKEIFLDVLFSLGVKSVLLSGLFRYNCVRQVENILESNGYLVDVSKHAYTPGGGFSDPKKSTGKVKTALFKI